jgi:hypothetical protein
MFDLHIILGFTAAVCEGLLIVWFVKKLVNGVKQ